MSGFPDHDRASTKPFLIERDDAGGYRLVVRETRYNSQNYPIVTTTPIDESFSSSAAARAYAKKHLGGAAGEFAIPKRSVG